MKEAVKNHLRFMTTPSRGECLCVVCTVCTSLGQGQRQRCLRLLRYVTLRIHYYD